MNNCWKFILSVAELRNIIRVNENRLLNFFWFVSIVYFPKNGFYFCFEFYVEIEKTFKKFLE